MLENIDKIVFTLFLFTAAFQDAREKSISIWLLGAGGFMGILLPILQGGLETERFLGILPGLALLFLSRMTQEAVGKGDGCFFIISGLFLELFLNIRLLLYGILLSGVFGGGFYFYSRLKGRDVRKTAMPFLPFLVPVWIGMVML